MKTKDPKKKDPEADHEPMELEITEPPKWPIKVTISDPIDVEGGMVSELELRKPTLRALYGVNLFVNTNTGELRIDLQDLAKAIASMANIPPSSAAQITLTDAMEMIDPVMDFLEASLPVTMK